VHRRETSNALNKNKYARSTLGCVVTPLLTFSKLELQNYLLFRHSLTELAKQSRYKIEQRT